MIAISCFGFYFSVFFRRYCLSF